MEEIWEDVVGYEGFYKVSNLGRVLRLKRIGTTKSWYKIKFVERYLSLKPNIVRGYVKVSLRPPNGKSKTFLVHRLVAQAFIPNPENKPQINHMNGIKNDNRVLNLEWCTQDENNKHALETGLLKTQKGERHGNAVLSSDQVLEICNLLDTTDLTRDEIASKYLVTGSTITDIHLGRKWDELTNRKFSIKPLKMCEINSKPVINCKGETFKSATEASLVYGFKGCSAIARVCSGKAVRAANLEWRYLTQEGE